MDAMVKLVADNVEGIVFEIHQAVLIGGLNRFGVRKEDTNR